MDSAELGDIIRGLTDESTDADRPFTGQPQTDFGVRGKTEVRGIRFRDLSDCAARAFVHACPECDLHGRAEDGTLNYNDLFDLNLADMDPLALIQNLCCEVEKMMGIYPNVPRLECNDELG